MKTILLSPPSTPGSSTADYAAAVARAGARPVLMPLPGTPDCEALAREALEGADALVLIGGGDLDPVLYGERPLPECGPALPIRDRADLALARAALETGKPVLAICRGIQALNVALGGTLYQDIPAQVPGSAEHQTRQAEAHTVSVRTGTLLYEIVGTGRLPATSRHHQAVKAPGKGLVVSAVSDDGIIEAVEFADKRPVIGVQWHPETLAADYPAHQALFDWLARAAGAGA